MPTDDLCSTPVRFKGGTTYVDKPTETEEKLTATQVELIEQQVAQITKQNELLDELWPTLESYYKAELEAQAELLPLTAEATKAQTEAAKAQAETAALQAEATAELLPHQIEAAKAQTAYATAQTEIATELLPYQKEAAIASTEAQVAATEYAKLQTEAAKALLPLQQELAEQGIELQSLQIDAIKSETERNAAIEPLLLEAMGYEKTAEGNYQAIEGAISDPILSSLEEQYQSMISGEYESPALESQIEKEKSNLENQLSQKLGSNWQTTTAGIQAMSEFDSRADMLRENARQSAQASTGSQYMSYRGLLAGEQQQDVSNLLALTGSTATSTGSTTGVGDINISDASSAITPSTASTNLGTSQAYSTSLGTSGLTGLMSGADTGSTMTAIEGVKDYYANQRYNQYAAQAGAEAGQSQAMMGGLMGGGQVGASLYGAGAVGGPAALGIAGAGLLAGYLLS